ncbi:RNA polymerase sigma-54 factor [Burkholderiales bacterium 8X]|nr:RNA polymerase sigma-54 factor [Burkholderiales bacterium 8X]
MTAIGLQARAIQSATFSPRLQHAVRLLQMSSLDYARELHQAAESNPFLEIDDASPPESTAELDGDASAWINASAMERAASLGSISARGLNHDESADALQGIPLTPSLQAHLHQQLGVLRLAEEERMFAAAVVESLDDDGYLRVSLDEIGAACGKQGTAYAAAWRTALRRVQSLDPCGVAARSVQECLQLQLPDIEDPDQRAIAREIVESHLDLLAAHNIPRLAAALGQPANVLRAVVERICRLNARPGWQFGEGGARVVTPDVIVRKVRGQWTTVLNDAAMPRVQLNRVYAQMFEKHRNREHAEMNGCLERARWTVQNLAQRVSTIHGVARAIVARQKMFLEYGPLAMKPLGLQEVADEVGVHASTVSRAVHDKYMATPLGVFELRYFFSRGMEHNGKSATSPAAIKALIGELIAAESRDDPLSDAELARQLAQQGFRIARRTVTKYRQALRVPAVEQRRHA